VAAHRGRASRFEAPRRIEFGADKENHLDLELARAAALEGIVLFAGGQRRKSLLADVALGVPATGSGAHCLHAASLGAAGVSHAVAMSDRPFADVGDDLQRAVNIEVPPLQSPLRNVP
jgi:hypothetical protein